ncbi:DUF2695 domain-containing protein [Mycobacterium riyadhense]|uniref:DUF2695 domain-containing protein n=1 Tax=Mycobacterium riyadhense TaxID=486698 RepID=UPI003F491070
MSANITGTFGRHGHSTRQGAAQDAARCLQGSPASGGAQLTLIDYDQLDELLNYIEETFDDQPCDHSPRHAQRWAESRGLGSAAASPLPGVRGDACVVAGECVAAQSLCSGTDLVCMERPH